MINAFRLKGGNVSRYTILDFLSVEKDILNQGGSGTWVPNQGLGGGVRPKAEKKKVTPINSMLEVVSDVPLATSDGFS